jgi:hypothetical protein
MAHIVVPPIRELGDVKLGSLVSFQYFAQTEARQHMGIRLEYEKSPHPAILVLHRDGNGKPVTFVVPRGHLANQENIHPHLWVVDHEDSWTLRTTVDAWDAGVRSFAYQDSESGLLVVGSSRTGVIALGRRGCCFVDFATWKVCEPVVEPFASTRKWTISIKGRANEDCDIFSS